jgi:hypothetical protein
VVELAVNATVDIIRGRPVTTVAVSGALTPERPLGQDETS